MTAIELEMYIKAAINKPAIVALGTVFVGFRILSEGTVADSIPRKAHKVRAAVAVMASKFEDSLMFKGVKFDVLK